MVDSFELKWFVKNIILKFKYYSLIQKRTVYSDDLVFIVQESQVYPGLADFMKSIVGAYYVAKLNNRHFKIVFDKPFLLQKYLIPNMVNWLVDRSELEKSFWNVKLINYRGLGRIPIIDKNCQYHLYNYLGINILQRNNVEGWKDIWHQLFFELFKPSDILKQTLSEIPFDENSYVSVHVRFLNSLETLEPGCLSWSKQLSSHDKRRLIERVLSIINQVKSEHKNVIVFSDSPSFLKIASDIGFCVLKGQVGHIGYETKEDMVLKTFFDWFAMSKAKTIYRIKGTPLYDSAFPLYASLIGNKEYVEIKID